MYVAKTSNGVSLAKYIIQIRAGWCLGVCLNYHVHFTNILCVRMAVVSRA